MKNLISIVTICVLLFACSGDDDNQNERLEASFTLLNYQCCLFEAEVFETGLVVWDFDGNGMVQITINTVLMENSQLPFQETGNYAYTVDGDRITIENRDYDFIIDGNTLVLSDSPESDGPIIRFEAL